MRFQYTHLADNNTFFPGFTMASAVGITGIQNHQARRGCAIYSRQALFPEIPML
jgi:hypothetical protein